MSHMSAHSCFQHTRAFNIISLSCPYIGVAVAYLLALYIYIYFLRSCVSSDLTMALQANGIQCLAQALAALCPIIASRPKISHISRKSVQIQPMAGGRCGFGDCHDYSICVQFSRWNMYSCPDSIAYTGLPVSSTYLFGLWSRHVRSFPEDKVS